MKKYFVCLLSLFAWIGISHPGAAYADSTISCPSGTYDMLDWMTMDSDLRSQYHLDTYSDPNVYTTSKIYTTLLSDKFYWVKDVQSGLGYPWDINLYDGSYIYQWITEQVWTDAHTYKKFTNNTNAPFAKRCWQAGFPGPDPIKISNSSFDIHTSCSSYTTKNLGSVIIDLWGTPANQNYGGDPPFQDITVLAVSYRYNCNSNYSTCSDKEEFDVNSRYGLVRWTHYTWTGSSWQIAKNSKGLLEQTTFNKLVSGNVSPYFPCF